MAFDFPASPSIDQDYVAGTVTYTYNGTGWVLKGTSSGQFVSKSGDTMTGNLTITKSGPQIILNKTAAGSPRGEILGQIAGSNRWALVMPSGGEDFAICRYDDTGTQIDVPFNIVRLTGQTNLPVTTASTSPTTGTLTVGGGLGVNGRIYSTLPVTVTGAGATEGALAAYSGNVNQRVSLQLGRVVGEAFFGVVANTGEYFGGSVAGEVIVAKGVSGGLLRIGNSGNGTTGITVAGTGQVALPGNIASTSRTTGTAIITGGLGVNGDIWGSSIHAASGLVCYTNMVMDAASDVALIYKYNSVSKVELYYVTASSEFWIYDRANSNNIIAFKQGTISTARVYIPGTQVASGYTSGALVVAGGVGIGGALHVGGNDSRISYNSGTSGGLYIISNNAALGGSLMVFLGSLGQSAGAIDYSGSQAAVTYRTTSDVRGKPNREILPHDRARDIIDALEVYDFDKDGNEIRGIGLIAQQAHKVHKSLAGPGRKADDYWMAEKAAPVPFLIANMQLLNKEIAELKRQLKEVT